MLIKDKIKLEFNPLTLKFDLISEFNSDRVVTHMFNSDGYTAKVDKDPSRKIERLILNSTSTLPVKIYSLHLNDGETAQVKIEFLGQQVDNQGRASFIQTGVFCRQGNNLTLQDHMQSDFTMKSDPDFDVSHILENNKIKFMVKNALPVQTLWTGRIEVQYLSTNMSRFNELNDIDPMIVVDNNGNIVLAG